MSVQPLSSSAIRILTFGYDAVLLDTRRLLLAYAGYASETVANQQGLEIAFSAVNPLFDMLIVCHTVPEEERSLISASAASTHVPLYCVPALVLPAEFLAQVSALLR